MTYLPPKSDRIRTLIRSANQLGFQCLRLLNMSIISQQEGLYFSYGIMEKCYG
jgi:hypothetical protein